MLFATEETVQCEVSPGLADRFDVTLTDGTRYVGAGIQGGGGLLRGPEALASAEAIIREKASGDARFTDVLIYTLHTAADYRFERVEASEIETITRTAEANA